MDALHSFASPYSSAVEYLGTSYWDKWIFGWIIFYCSYILT